MHQSAQICKLNFKNFLGAMPQTPILGRDYGAPPQTLLPSALRRFAPTAPHSARSSSARSVPIVPVLQNDLCRVLESIDDRLMSSQIWCTLNPPNSEN